MTYPNGRRQPALARDKDPRSVAHRVLTAARVSGRKAAFNRSLNHAATDFLERRMTCLELRIIYIMLNRCYIKNIRMQNTGGGERAAA